MVKPGGTRRVVFSGMRPTGRLHLGNYWGALKNWVALQNEYQCFYSIVDWHMLTTGYEETQDLQQNVREMLLDWLAAGLDPEKCVIFRQSSVSAHAEMTLLLSMVTPLSWLENNPTWKEQLQELAKTKERLMSEEVEAMASTEKRPAAQHGKTGKTGVELGDKATRKQEEQKSQAESLRTYGFLGYPVLQAADILLYDGEFVPVGHDQLPHIELSREIARRFNSIYGEVLTEPKPLLTPTPKVPGIDGRKMSKSYGNAVDICETAESLKTKVMSMYTDRNKIRASDHGHPEPCAENPPGCVVYALHKLYSDYAERRGTECRGGAIGCVACKKDLLASLEKPYNEFCRSRERFERDPGLTEQIMEEGGRRARAVAEGTLEKVRRAMRLK